MQTRIREYLKEVSRKLERPLRVCLLGYGTTNRAVLDIISDTEICEEITIRQNRKIHDTPPGEVRFITESIFDGIYEDVIFASPSFRREKINFPKDCIVTSDTEIFFGEKRNNTFLISGSDGKSTVTTLASLLLSPTFPDLFTGGNLGYPVAEASLKSDAFVLELSSFNLRYSAPIGGRAILTNVTPNHLDWHADLNEYEQTKKRLVYSAEEPILTLSCPFNERLAYDIPTFALVSMKHTDEELRKSYKTRHTVTVRTGEILVDGTAVLPISIIRSRERHNIENLMSAIALSLGYTTEERIREVATSFSGLEHRCERFSLDGIEYVNSSIDTTPERTRATLTSLDRPVNLILGGRGKGLTLEPLREPILRYAKRISVYGEIADEICQWLESDDRLALIPHAKFEDFVSTLGDADDNAKRNETVLLSPAATSYGEFKDFAERGRTFKNYINKKHPRI